jgi:hypothetical protein
MAENASQKSILHPAWTAPEPTSPAAGHGCTPPAAEATEGCLFTASVLTIVARKSNVSSNIR